MNTLDNSLAKPLNQLEIQCLNEFRSRIRKTNLNCPMDDVYLLGFLRHRNLDLNRALETIHEFWKQAKVHKDVCERMFPSNFKEIYENKFYHPLNSRDGKGRQVALIRMANWNYSKHSLFELIQANYAISDTVITRQLTQLNGIVCIVDFDGIGISCLRSISLKILKFCFDFMNVMPIKLKGYHIVNNSPLTNGLWKCIQAFLKPKLRKRIYVHGTNFESLHKYLDPEILPQAYGGKLQMNEAYEDNFMDKVLARDNYYRDLFKYCENVKEEEKFKDEQG